MALTSGLLARDGFRHGFFTRLGGVSQPPWDSLNFQFSTGDDAGAVSENLRRAAQILGVEPTRLYYLSQVHGTVSQLLDGTKDRDEVVHLVGDITLSRVAGVGCGIRTADCVPILVGDRTTGAVAAIHSGWRGTLAGAAQAGIRALRKLIGAEGDLIAAIGPHIERCCFEVGPDVAEELAGASRLGRAVVIEREGARPHVDLRRIVRAQLEAEGLDDARIDDVPGCTVCDRERFHSYRRDGDRSGRLLSAIVVRA